MTDLQDQFDEFIDRISLTDKQLRRIGSAFDGLHEYLTKYYKIPAADVFIQGSVANGTAIQPLPGGEYDLDIVVIVPNAETLSADKALGDLEKALKEHGRYADKLEPKKPCVRIRYADDEIGGFHIDVTPCRVDQTGEAPLQAPRRGDGWHGTAPREYTTWCLAQGEGFQRTVKALKRWRDEHQTVREAVKSIVLQVLVSRCIPPTFADGPRLATTLTELHALLTSQPGVLEVWNPVLPSENLAASWSQESFNSFRQAVAAAEAKAREAVEADDDADAAAIWAEILGEDFPLVTADEVGLTLGDTSHAKRIEDEGWYANLDPKSSISISADVMNPHSTSRKPLHRGYDGTTALKAGWNIRFTANVVSEQGGSVWWQVVNTGGHARSVGGLRGEFFKAKGRNRQPSPNERINWEDTSYTGTHWIEAFLVRGSAVVARSDPLLVHIMNRQHRFSR